MLVESMGDDLSGPVTSYNTHQNGILTECRVCDAPTTRNHYAIASCNACAAFFRRSIIQRRNFFCTKKDCSIIGSRNSKKACKACRFKRCVDVGMIIDSVWKRRLLEENGQFIESTLLQRMLKAKQATFMNKVNLMSKLAIKLNVKMNMGSLKPSKIQTEMSKLSEFDVLLIYLHDVGFEDLGLDKLEIAKVAAMCFYRWMLLSALVVTLRNSGLYSNMAYFSDRGHIPVNYDQCYERLWCRFSPSIFRGVFRKKYKSGRTDYLLGHDVNGGFPKQNLSILSESWYKVLCKGMSIAKNVHTAKLDKTEFASLTLLMVLQQARELYPANRKIAEQINCLFNEMNTYFKQNYADTSVRLGNMVLMLNEINSIQLEANEFSGLLTLSGYDTVLYRVMRAYGLMEQPSIKVEYTP